MTDNFIYDSYYGKTVFDTKTGKYYVSGYESFSIYNILNIIDPTDNKYTFSMTNLLILFNLAFLNGKNNCLYPINFSIRDVKLYIVRLEELESRIFIKICILVQDNIKDINNKRQLQETKIIETIINLISKNYPNMYNEVMMEVKLGRKSY